MKHATKNSIDSPTETSMRCVDPNCWRIKPRGTSTIAQKDQREARRDEHSCLWWCGSGGWRSGY